MRRGFGLPPTGKAASPEAIATVARRAEETFAYVRSGPILRTEVLYGLGFRLTVTVAVIPTHPGFELFRMLVKV